ncbi:MAG: phosphatase PAP2 family protein [Desulfobulbaceae bacterium]|nr:phosphatase PAP2 family protein [Desulfobulbaceae bacterium]
MVLLVGFFLPRWQRLRIYAVFKDHLGHPRPRQIVEFEGKYQYIPPLQKGDVGKNSSFPSGHVAIAFNISLFWFIWRRGRPRLAVVSLGVAIGCAGGMGLARLMDGAHFLSDILCAMFLSFLV